MDLDARMDAAEGPRCGPDGNAVCYHQHCPVCGRTLRIRVTLLGQQVFCQHCGGGFIASDATGDDRTSRPEQCRSEQVEHLLERAAVVLSRAAV